MSRNHQGRLSNPNNVRLKSTYSYKASKIFNQHVFGEETISFETLQYNKANYLNPSLSIKLPIFSIHGNHDDPTGLDMISSLD
jgi:DNA repair exonuclease SbcCD nuclease subunit